MAKKCIPGVICIESLTLGFLLIVTVFMMGYLYIMISKKTDNKGSDNNDNNKVRDNLGILNPFTFFFQPNVPYSNIPGDVYMNPYSAPLQDTRYMVPSLDIRDGNIDGNMRGRGGVMGVPINVSTQSVDTHYRQLGILTRAYGGEETILPLMGRPLFVSRDKFQYYTLSDKNNSVKLPVSVRGKSCTGEYGCDSLSNGDMVYVEGYNDAFRVTMYDNATINYIPYI